MLKTIRALTIFLGLLLLAACVGPERPSPMNVSPTIAEITSIPLTPTTTASPIPPTTTAIPLEPDPTITPGEQFSLSEAEAATLSSLVQVDDYPLYVMHYHGDYLEYTWAPQTMAGTAEVATWGCSLFAALGDPENRVYGRNFDWQYSPALLLFTDPPQGFASVSMQSVRFMGSFDVDATDLENTTLEERYMLLYTPIRPYDGMNEAGLAIGMAAVPTDGTSYDPNKPDIDSLMLMRQVLDHAANVSEAVEIVGQYNVIMESGPPVHYLIADSSGLAVLVEFLEGEMVVIPNENPWHAATNFFFMRAGDHPENQCWRYRSIAASLEGASGWCTAAEAMAMLEDVFQEITQWSVVYNLSTREIDIVMGGEFPAVHTFLLED